MKPKVSIYAVKRWAVGLLRGLLGPWLDRRVYTVRGGIAQGLKRRGGRGFLRVPLTAEERFVAKCEFAGKTVYDIGAYHGVFTLFFARAAGPEGRVVTFEPNPANHRRVLENVALNGFEKVQVFKVAVGREASTATLVFRNCERSMGSIACAQQEELGDWGEVERVAVRVVALDEFIAQEKLPPPDFVKIDVEGHEMAVLEGMTRTLDEVRPVLYIEVHGVGAEDKRRNVSQMTAFLTERGYRLHHVESERAVTASDFAHALEGHLFGMHGEEGP